MGLVVLVLGAAFVYLRYGRRNFHTVVDGQIYRSAQPDGKSFRTWATRHRFKTVLNLRGAEYLDEVQQVIAAAEQMGVTYVQLRLPNRELPEPADICRLIEILETAERPLLLHCRAGADRSGVASVMAAMAVGNRSYDDARRQLSAYYLHFDYHPDHVAGILKRYQQYCRRENRGHGGWQEFRTWAHGPYAETWAQHGPRPATNGSSSNLAQTGCAGCANRGDAR